jgi:hypothetical protein
MKASEVNDDGQIATGMKQSLYLVIPSTANIPCWNALQKTSYVWQCWSTFRPHLNTISSLLGSKSSRLK